MAIVDLKGFDPLLVERASRIRLLALDVDGVLTDGKLYYDSLGNETKAFCTRDGLGLRALQRYDTELAFITGRESSIVQQRAAELDIRHVYQGRNDKLNAYLELLAATGADDREVCYAGDDWIDIPVLDRVGLAVTVADADTIVKQRVHWVTERAGGQGAVREICDLILAARGLDDRLFRELFDQ